MNLINIIPKMTSNNTPEPYKCIPRRNTHQDIVYHAFDGNKDTILCGYGARGYKIEFAFEFDDFQFIDALQVITYDNDSYTKPTIIALLGLNPDTKSYEAIISTTNFDNNTIIYLENRVKYKTFYFQISCGSGNGITYVSEIKLFRDTSKDDKTSKFIKEKTLETILNNKYFNNTIPFNESVIIGE